MRVNWRGVRRRVAQGLLILGLWSLVEVILEALIAPFGPLRRSFPAYGVVVPAVAFGLVVLALATGWLWVGLADDEPPRRAKGSRVGAP